MVGTKQRGTVSDRQSAPAEGRDDRAAITAEAHALGHDVEVARKTMTEISVMLTDVASFTRKILAASARVKVLAAELPLSGPDVVARQACDLAAADPVIVAAAAARLQADYPETFGFVGDVLAKTDPLRVPEVAAHLTINEPERLGTLADLVAKETEAARVVPQPEPPHAATPPPHGARRALGLVLRDGPGALRRRGAHDPRGAAPQPPVPSSPADQWYAAEDPEVSIVVLNFNKASLTAECVASLRECTTGYRYEIVLVDNGSSDDELRILNTLEGDCRLVRIPVNRYFGEGNNIGVESAKGRYVVLMNNDVTVTEGWLEPLMARLHDEPDCGAVGPKFLYPNGLLQEAGALLDDEGLSTQIGKFQDPHDPAFNRARVVDYVSAACVLLRTDDFVRVLGFDMMYEPAYYEDADLCLKLRRLGLRTYYEPSATVVHHESVTTRDTSHGLKLTNIADLNKRKFVKRWGEYLRTGVMAPAAAPVPLITATAGTTGRTVAVYSPYDVTPGGGERFVLSLMEQFLHAGHAVSFVTPAPYSRMRITALSDMFGIDLTGLRLLTEEEAKRLAPFDEFISMGNELVPRSPAMGLRNTFLCQFPFPLYAREDWITRTPWLSGYDRIAVYSEFAAEAVRAGVADKGLVQLPIEIITPAVTVSERPLASHKQGILSVGRFFEGCHSKRQDLQIEAFRQLVATNAAAGSSLHLVGSSSPVAIHRQFLLDCIAAAEGLDVHFHIDAPASEVADLYDRCSIYWHSSGLDVDPAVAPENCEHFGIAPIEAMSYGTIPVVVAYGGPATTVRDGIEGFHYTDLDELVGRTAELLNMSEAELRPLRERDRARAEDYTTKVFAATVPRLFDL